MKPVASVLCCGVSAIALTCAGCSDEPKVGKEVEEELLLKAEEDDRRWRAEAERIKEERRKQAEAAQAEEAAKKPNPPPEKADATELGPPPEASEETPKPPAEKPPAEPRPPNARNAGPAKDAAWRQIRGGMPDEEVKKLLGPPTSMSRDVFVTYWFYGTGERAGKVALMTPSGQVIAWDPPLE